MDSVPSSSQPSPPPPPAPSPADPPPPPPPPANPSMVDPFLVEALQNPRHRLTILRMELDIQKFLQNSDFQQFELCHFPTSYLRLASHKVAQHYGLITVVKDNAGDGLGSRILVKKQAECKYPTVCLSDIPAKELDAEKNEHIKIVIKSRPRKASQNEIGEPGLKHIHMRTVEERKEEYDRVRARIFSGPSGAESDDMLTSVPLENTEYMKSFTMDLKNNFVSRENCASSRVAILRDREKDRADPDYDRTYEKSRQLVAVGTFLLLDAACLNPATLEVCFEDLMELNRYIRYAPGNQGFSLASYVQKFQHPYVQYDSVLPQLGQVPQAQASLNYSSPVMSPFCALGLNQTSRDVLYMQWPSQSMMYAQSYGQLRHAVFQAPFCQQPLSFDHSQNY